MHWDIALNKRECMVGNQHCVWSLIGLARINGTMSNRVARFIEMLKKICVGYYEVGIDPPG